MNVSVETKHRYLLTVSLPANEGRLRKHLWEYSPKQAFEFIETATSDEPWLAMALSRARSRLQRFDLASSLQMTENLKIGIHHPDIFPNLRDLEHQSPWLIFSKGDIQLTDFTAFTAVVGTRQASPLGLETTQKVVSQFSEKESLVSGGANGIDMAAHQQASYLGKNQLMVVSSGLHTIFPIAAKKFVDSGFFGAVISEQPPLLNSGKIGFLNRNRLIAALSSKLYLIEAPVVSGAINTAQHALSLGRAVYCCLDQNSEYSPGGAWLAKNKKPGHTVFIVKPPATKTC